MLRNRKNLHGSYVQSGSAPQTKLPRKNLYRLNYTRHFDVDLETLEDIDDEINCFPQISNGYRKGISQRERYENLAPVRGILKRFEGKSFDEYYSYLRQSVSSQGYIDNLLCEMSTWELYRVISSSDRVLFGIPVTQFHRHSGRISQLSDGDFYLNGDQIITKYKAPVIVKKSTPKKKGFYYIQPCRTAEEYYIGPFFVNQSKVSDFEIEDGFSSNIVIKNNVLKPPFKYSYLESIYDRASTETYYLRLELKSRNADNAFFSSATKVRVNHLFPS